MTLFPNSLAGSASLMNLLAVTWPSIPSGDIAGDNGLVLVVRGENGACRATIAGAATGTLYRAFANADYYAGTIGCGGAILKTGSFDLGALPTFGSLCFFSLRGIVDPLIQLPPTLRPLATSTLTILP